MRRATLLAVSLLIAGFSPHDGASGQTAPPVSLTPPKASPPRTNAKPAASDRLPSAPAIGGLPSPPNSAADYDGFSAVGDDNDTPDPITRPTTSRAAKGAKSNPDSKGAAQQMIDQEDEALKRKLTICNSCK